MSATDCCSEKKSSLEVLVEEYKTMFRIPENVNYYSEEDYRLAERKFVKHRLDMRTRGLNRDL